MPALSASAYMKNPFFTSVALYWSCSTVSMSLLCCRPQHWTEHSRYVSLVLRRITSSDLATVFWCSLARWFWFVFFHACKGELLAYGQLIVHYQVLFCKDPFQLVRLKPIHFHRVILSQMMDLVFSLFELHKVSFRLFLQPFTVPMNSSTTIWYISHSSQFQIT